MEIPKTKILIYALTFMGYAWSGYGANVISNLRDAVLSAENIFGDVFQKVLIVAKQFRNVRDVLDAAVEESCEYKCPSGSVPVPNKFHKPTSNGCGSYGLELHQHLSSKDITVCCDNHDVCYDTCNSGKEKCDFDMQRCLYKLCDVSGLSEKVLKACKATAKAMFTGTITFGCRAYLDSQQKACYCNEGFKKSKRFTGGEL